MASGHVQPSKHDRHPMSHRCPVCGSPADTARCAACGAPIYSVDDENFPPITWEEVREHLVQRLFIDDAWRVDGSQQFAWWPWFLRQEVAVTATDPGLKPGRPDALTRITATTETLRVTDKALGLRIVAEANRKFPLGAFILQDDVVRATSSVALNPLCRGMLTALHQAALIQVIIAHEIANNYRDLPGVTVLESSHPQSGPRHQPDELLAIYSGETCSLPPVEGFCAYLSSARPIYRRILLDGGLEAGFTNDDVDFFDGDRLDIALGTIEGDPLERRFGPGLVVMTRFLSPGSQTPATEVNMMNQAISQIPEATQLGAVLGDERAIRYGLHTRTYLDHGFLASVRGNSPDRLAIEVVNAVYHNMAAVHLLLAYAG